MSVPATTQSPAMLQLADSLAQRELIPTPTPGIYPAVPMGQYHAWDPAASNSRLSVLRRSPAHLRAYLETPSEDTPATLLGRATHCALLEPDVFNAKYVAAPALDRRTKAGREAWDALVGEYGDGFVLKAEDYATCLEIRDAFHGHTSARAMLGGEGKVELSVVWQDAETGVTCKGRLDRLSPVLAGGVIVDLKSTRDAGRREFERSIFAYGYHRQGAFYLDAAKALGIPVEHYVIVAFEKEPPYAVAVYRLTEGALDAGREQIQPLLRQYASLLAVPRSEWPGYPEAVQDIAIPAYGWQQIDEEVKERTEVSA